MNPNGTKIDFKAPYFSDCPTENAAFGPGNIRIDVNVTMNIVNNVRSINSLS